MSILSLVVHVLNGQLTTSTAMSPTALVQNVLLGTGVTVSNITYNGSPSAIGSFSATNTSLGIDQGILLTTGTVLNNGSGPQGPNNQAGCGMDNGIGSSSLLTSLLPIGSQTFNAATLEFDFIPFSDTVRFKYVFGSDEYPEFAPPNNTSYNDVFGFFISGPGFSGLQNIARLPTNGSIVSINNVNSVTNSQFYRFNGDGTNAPYNNSPFYIQYDGFTRVLEAVARVQCGQTYHLIIALADVGDGQWDSGIFLEANSLSSTTPLTVDYVVNPTHFSDPDYLAEGCSSATVTVTRAGNLSVPYSLPVIVSGTASNNVDYSGVPDAISFGPGQSTVTFTVNAIEDSDVELLETLKITFPLVDPCGNETPISILLYIHDVPLLNVNLNNPTILCAGDNINLTGTVTGGLAPYSFLWSTGATTSSISVNPSQTGEYWLQVTDICTSSPAYDTIEVQVPIYQPLTIITPADITEICPKINHTLTVTPIGGSGTYTIVWREAGNPIPIGNTNSVNISPSGSTWFYVQVTDNCGSVGFDTIYYTVLSPPLVVIPSPNVEICPGDSTYIFGTATGGYGAYSYFWPHNGATTTGVWVKPNQTQYYEIRVEDECGTFYSSGFIQVVVVKPDANFLMITNDPMANLPLVFQNLTSNGYTYDWYFGDGGYSNSTHPVHTYTEDGIYYVTLIATDIKGCVDSITKPIEVFEEFYIYIPNTFIPNADRYNNTFSGSFIGVKSIKMEIFNRWGESLFYSEDQNFSWDGTVNGKRVPDGTYTWKLVYIPNRGIEHLLTGHVNVLH